MAYPTEFNVTRDSGGAPAYALYPTTLGGRLLLTADTAESFTLPLGGFWMVNLNYTIQSVYVSYNSDVTASVPSGNDTEASPLNPGPRTVPGGTTISCITNNTDGAVVSYELYLASYNGNM